MICTESSTVMLTPPGPVCSRSSDVGCPIGILLYLLDIAFRLAQQVQPVVVSNVSACKSATLATLHFNADPHTPIKPIQVCCSLSNRCCFSGCNVLCS